MKNLISLFRTDSISKWAKSKEKVWRDAEVHYEKSIKDLKENQNHLVYLCSPLRPTKQKLAQDHISDAISAASQILGAEYKGKKISIWIPHVHLFSIYNEIVYPESRGRAIKFNNYLLEKYFQTLLVVGKTISGGMETEIELAKKSGVKVVELRKFRKELENLPDLKKAEASCRKMISLHNQIHGRQFLIKQ